jgi:hypothetical protein
MFVQKRKKWNLPDFTGLYWTLSDSPRLLNTRAHWKWIGTHFQQALNTWQNSMSMYNSPNSIKFNWQAVYPCWLLAACCLAKVLKLSEKSTTTYFFQSLCNLFWCVHHQNKIIFHFSSSSFTLNKKKHPSWVNPSFPSINQSIPFSLL